MSQSTLMKLGRLDRMTDSQRIALMDVVRKEYGKATVALTAARTAAKTATATRESAVKAEKTAYTDVENAEERVGQIRAALQDFDPRDLAMLGIYLD
ncbi:hypothetical protein AB0E01_22890 [Nocardia vinacea]|uniref:hypothetical protein n=1 Tax=Nocardia vinacea TaxID=96468 RepID=UPI0033D0DBEB